MNRIEAALRLFIDWGINRLIIAVRGALSV